MANQRYAVVMHSETPSELRALLKDYLQTHDPSMTFLLCVELDNADRFLRCRLAQNKARTLDWIQIPYDYVVAIVEIAQGQSPGFLSGAQ